MAQAQQELSVAQYLDQAYHHYEPEHPQHGDDRYHSRYAHGEEDLHRDYRYSRDHYAYPEHTYQHEDHSYQHEDYYYPSHLSYSN